jgi:hypothetical protein
MSLSVLAYFFFCLGFLAFLTAASLISLSCSILVSFDVTGFAAGLLFDLYVPTFSANRVY